MEEKGNGNKQKKPEDVHEYHIEQTNKTQKQTIKRNECFSERQK